MNPQKHFEEAKSGAVIDPACGMTVQPESAAGSFEYDGRTYYFCSFGVRDCDRRPPYFLSLRLRATSVFL
jgi:Cu+-exporting ATPase